MISRDAANVSSPTSNNLDPCSAVLPYPNHGDSLTPDTRSGQNSGSSRSSKCYRPLQQLYKTIYSPTSGNASSPINFACICRPSERYKTTNMTYGSFHYNNWAFIQKNRPVNYDTQLFTRSYDNNNKQKKVNKQSKFNEYLTE